MILKILYALLALLIVLLICPIGMFLERRDFNNGICVNCGSKLIHFDNDSQGGRGYCCDNCGYSTWVSYNSVDKKFDNGGKGND